MSEPGNVTSEVTELMELVCGKPGEDVAAAITNDIPTSSQIQILENVLISNVEVQQPIATAQLTEIQPTIVEPTVTASIDVGNDASTPTVSMAVLPEAEPRIIESNALKMIAQYGSDSDSVSEYESENESDTESSDDVVEVIMEKTIAAGNYRVISSESEDSTSSDDSDCEVISVKNEIINLDDDDLCELNGKHKGPIKSEGEFTIDSLPPIEDLHISVSEEQCVVLGKIVSIVDQLVVVESLQGSRPIDIDSVLFLEKGTKPLGHVFDVLGNISSPMYCVRFNSNKQIQEKGITVGELVYVAPQTEHTSFVIVSDLMKQKGCDASWKNDNESQSTMDFSDDEEERKARRSRRGRSESCESESSNIQNMEYDNSQNSRQYRMPRRGRGYTRGRGQGGPQHGRNYSHGNHFDSPSSHSWHHNLQPSYRNAPWQGNARPMGVPFSDSFLLPPPPPPKM